MTTLQADDNGLPLPGRELDAAVWEIIDSPVHWYWASRTAIRGEWLPVELASVPEQELKPWYRIKLVERGAEWACKQPFYLSDNGVFFPVPEVSTTHAFFQAMEAMGIAEVTGDYFTVTECWEAHGGRSGSRVKALLRKHYRLTNIGVWLDDYPSREKAYAHAVCCCCYLWKTQR